MIVRWFGQSAFLLTGSKRVLIDPFGALGERLAERGITFRHPPVEGVSADLVLVTHEHSDHNAVDGAEGSPVVIRSTAGTLDSPIGEIVAIASEHDDRAGTQRGPSSRTTAAASVPPIVGPPPIGTKRSSTSPIASRCSARSAAWPKSPRWQ